ncbi:hypothetical protein Zmor_026070 [Zophobas morio]|uniref:Uncharacterized protein n=1 Tax=Zophobas morio TaxID=2755281 RepID=A0AA38HSX9_9CUCU|nr:hypothetical protein Zmor_026070 [Zophobas morio]
MVQPKDETTVRLLRKAWSVMGARDISNVCSITRSKEKHIIKISSTKCARKLKTASTFGDLLAGKNKVPREVKIGSLTKGSSPTIPGNIDENCVTITIDTGAEVSILRRGFLRAKDLRTIP